MGAASGILHRLGGVVVAGLFDESRVAREQVTKLDSSPCSQRIHWFAVTLLSAQVKDFDWQNAASSPEAVNELHG